MNPIWIASFCALILAFHSPPSAAQPLVFAPQGKHHIIIIRCKICSESNRFSTASDGQFQPTLLRTRTLDDQISEAISHTVDLLGEGRKLIAELVQLRKQVPSPIMGSFPTIGSSVSPIPIPQNVEDIPVRSSSDDLLPSSPSGDGPPVISSVDAKPDFSGSVHEKDAPGNRFMSA